jgi:hypothetical protein
MRGSLATLLFILAHATARGQSLPTFVTTPTLTIGDTLSDPHFRFERLVDAKRLSDGRIVAALCPAAEIRAFDATGRFLSSLNVTESPGPQRFLWRLMPAGGDTLAMFESLNSRLTLVGPDLKVIRTVPIPNPDTTTRQGRLLPSRLDVVGRFADGSFLGRLNANPTLGAGRHRRNLSLYHFSNDGALLDSLIVPGVEANSIAGERFGQAIRMGRTTNIAVFGDRVIVGDQTVPVLAEFGSNLRPMRQVSTFTKPIPMSDSVKGAWTRIAVERTMTPTNGVLSVFGDSYPDSTPAFRDIVAGNDGRTWVQDPLGADFYPLIWTAYQNGRAVARAELPPRFYPTQFGADWVMGLAYDTTTIDKLQLLTLTPGRLTNQRLPPKDAAPANRPRCGAWVSR